MNISTSWTAEYLSLLVMFRCCDASRWLPVIDEHFQRGNAATVLTSIPPDATGYGRIVRDGDGRVKKIVEQADCTNEEQKIREINTGIFFSTPRRLMPHWTRLIAITLKANTT